MNTLRIGLVSISDRASSGVYQDKGIPALEAWLARALSTPFELQTRLIPDEQVIIEQTLCELVDEMGCHLVLTTGGTGPARRDVTPDATLAIAVVSIPSYVRLTRAAVLNEKNRDYVTSSRVAGASVLRLMFIVILPNCLAPLIVQMTMGISNAILELATLGFLGIGAKPPTPELGTMLSESRSFMQAANWLVTIPGLVILSLVLAFNLMGDGLRDALDPKLKQ